MPLAISTQKKRHYFIIIFNSHKQYTTINLTYNIKRIKNKGLKHNIDINLM
jgi:hypothetical protein